MIRSLRGNPCPGCFVGLKYNPETHTEWPPFFLEKVGCLLLSTGAHCLQGYCCTFPGSTAHPMPRISQWHQIDHLELFTKYIQIEPAFDKPINLDFLVRQLFLHKQMQQRRETKSTPALIMASATMRSNFAVITKNLAQEQNLRSSHQANPGSFSFSAVYPDYHILIRY